MSLRTAAEGWFSRSIGFPLIVNGGWRTSKNRRRFKRLLREKAEMEGWPLERQRARQLEGLRVLLNHAGARVPYYRDLFASIGFDPLGMRTWEEIRKIPPLTKDLIRENADRLLAEDATRRGIIRSSSGGSTGRPVHFCVDANCREHGEAAAWRGDMAAGRQMGDRTALLWGADRDAKTAKGMKGLGYGLLRNEWWFNSFDLSEERMRRYHETMQRHPPDVLLAYASSAYLFASFLEANGIEPRYPTKSIITSAEVLTAEMRRVITRVFRRPVFDRYGCRELGLIAFECAEHRGLHINTSDLVLERVGDESGAEPAELLITQLNNLAMPFIRFRIEDMAVMGEEGCPCGRRLPLLKRIVGRTSDTITTRSGRLIHGEYFTHLLYGVAGIVKFRFVQETLDRYILYIVPGHGFDPAVLESAKGGILEAVGEGARLEVETVQEIPPAQSGKFLFTVSKVPVAFMERGGE